MAGVKSIARYATVRGAAHTASVPVYVDSDDNRLKFIPAGSGTTEVVLQEAYGASLQEILTAAKTVTAAETGKTFSLALAGGFTVALPAPAVGLRYKFYVNVAPTTAYIITATPLAGQAHSSTGGNASSITGFTGVDLRFVANVALIGDSAEFVSDGTNWYVHGFSNADAGITIN
jgi:hypothetical protein